MDKGKTSDPVKSADMVMQTIGMLIKADALRIYTSDIGDKRYIEVIDKVGGSATYYRVDKSSNEIEFASDGRPTSYMVQGLIFRNMTGSVVVAAGTDEKDTKSKIDFIQKALKVLDKDARVYHGSDELDPGLVRITIHYPHWMMRDIDMVRMLDKFEETFAKPAGLLRAEDHKAVSGVIEIGVSRPSPTTTVHGAEKFLHSEDRGAEGHNPSS